MEKLPVYEQRIKKGNPGNTKKKRKTERINDADIAEQPSPNKDRNPGEDFLPNPPRHQTALQRIKTQRRVKEDRPTESSLQVSSEKRQV